MKQATKVDNYPIETICPYCGGEVIFTTNDFIYGRKYGNGLCYVCVSCKANVGVHTGTTVPKGRLADKELAELRKECHALFDPIWHNGVKTGMSRRDVYTKLAEELGIPRQQSHIAWFTKEELLQVIGILEKRTWGRDV